MKNASLKNKTTPGKRSRASQAYNILKGRIIEGKLPPGMQLVEQDLCEQLSMSRTPIREALNRLRAEGLVEYRHGRGSLIAPITKEKVKQTYEALEAVESMMFYLVAEDHENPAFADAEKALLEMERTAAKRDWDAWVLADKAFHENIRKCCKNRYIAEQCDILNRPSHQFRMLITKTHIDKSVSTRDHRLTFDAMARGDAREARDSAQKHYFRLRRQIIAFLDQYGLFN
jgi:DNA-binding GntR family transcriptional regulator